MQKLWGNLMQEGKDSNSWKKRLLHIMNWFNINSRSIKIERKIKKTHLDGQRINQQWFVENKDTMHYVGCSEMYFWTQNVKNEIVVNQTFETFLIAIRKFTDRRMCFSVPTFNIKALVKVKRPSKSKSFDSTGRLLISIFSLRYSNFQMHKLCFMAYCPIDNSY